MDRQPLGTIPSAAMMLGWLAECHNHSALGETAVRIRRAVEKGLSDGSLQTRDLGGKATTADVVAELRERLQSP